MKKGELITKLARNTGIEKEIIAHTIQCFLDELQKTVANGESLDLHGFGSFFSKKRAAKKALNIRTKTAVLVEEHYIPFFKPSANFTRNVREKMNKNKI